MSNSPVATKKLGQLLVENGWITGEQLIRAIQSQRVVGGRIGTCLLEMDVLTEEKLLEALSDQLRVPSAQIEELRAIGGEVLDLIPSKVASRWQTVPLSADRTDIRVATLNVRNLACLDEIEFCSNKRVLPHIANEVRIFEALERYYGVECPRRYGHLLDRLNRSRYLWDDSAKVLLGGGQRERGASSKRRSVDSTTHEAGGLMRPAMARSAVGLGMPSPTPPSPPGNEAIIWPSKVARDPVDRDPVDRDPVARDPVARDPVARGAEDPPSTVASAGDSPVPAAIPSSSPETGPLSFDDVESLLATQSDRKSIGQTILRFLSQSFSRCAIFAVRPDGIRGWIYRGEGFDAALFQALDLKLDQPSAFLGLIKGAEFFSGPLAPMPAHRELASCWGGELPQQCVMMPIRLRGRLISVLYGDRGALDLKGVCLEQIKELSEKAGIAFELCILRSKLRQKPPSSELVGRD